MAEITLTVSVPDGGSCQGCGFFSQVSYRDQPTCALFQQDVRGTQHQGYTKCPPCDDLSHLEKVRTGGIMNIMAERDEAVARAEKAEVEAAELRKTLQYASVAEARLEVLEPRLKLADRLLYMAETTLGPRTTPGLERVAAARALMRAMREAGYNVDPA